MEKKGSQPMLAESQQQIHKPGAYNVNQRENLVWKKSHTEQLLLRSLKSSIEFEFSVYQGEPPREFDALTAADHAIDRILQIVAEKKYSDYLNEKRQPFTVSSTLHTFLKVFESGEIAPDNRRDEVYLRADVIAEEQEEPQSMGEKETYMSLKRTIVQKVPQVITSPASKDKRSQSQLSNSFGKRTKTNMLDMNLHESFQQYGQATSPMTKMSKTSSRTKHILHSQKSQLREDAGKSGQNFRPKIAKLSQSRLSYGSNNIETGSIKNFSNQSNNEAKLNQDSDNLSVKSHRSMRSNKSYKSNTSAVSRKSYRRRKADRPEYRSIPLKRQMTDEDPDDPILKKLEQLRIEVHRKDMMKKIDAQEAEKQRAKMKMIEQAGGGSAFKSSKKGKQGLGITTDHYGNLIQINRKGIRFSHLAQPETEIRLIAMEKAKQKLAQAARLRIENDSHASTMVEKYHDVVKYSDEKEVLQSGAVSSSGENQKEPIAIKKIQSDKTSINASNYNFGSRDNRGSLIGGNTSSGLAMKDIFAEDVLGSTGFGKPVERHPNDTASSCFTKKKDRNYQDMQTVLIQESVQVKKMRAGVSISMQSKSKSNKQSNQQSRAGSKEDESRLSKLNSQILSTPGGLTAMDQRRLHYLSKANAQSRMVASENELQNDLIDGSLGSVMYTSEVSQRIRHAGKSKSRVGGSSHLHFGRILCNNISEAASFVYDTMPDVTVQSTLGDNYASPPGELDQRIFVSQDNKQIQRLLGQQNDGSHQWNGHKQRNYLSQDPSKNNIPRKKRGQATPISNLQRNHEVYSDMKHHQSQLEPARVQATSHERNVDATFSYLPQIKGIHGLPPQTSENSLRVRLPSYQRRQRLNLSQQSNRDLTSSTTTPMKSKIKVSQLKNYNYFQKQTYDIANKERGNRAEQKKKHLTDRDIQNQIGAL